MSAPTTAEVFRVAPGLTSADIVCRRMTSVEAAACDVGGATDGVVFPYASFQGKPIPMYRVRAMKKGNVPGYFRPRNSLPRIYCPHGLGAHLEAVPRQQRGGSVLFVTVGEENSAALMKHGFPAIALPGVDEWLTRKLLLPADVKIHNAGERIQVEIPGYAAGTDEINTQVVEGTGALIAGLVEVIDYCVHWQMRMIICFPTAVPWEPHATEVFIQKQAALLGYEMRYRGLSVPQICSLTLPSMMSPTQYLDRNGRDELVRVVRGTLSRRSSFPRHPNARKFVSGKLQRARISRKEQHDISLSMLTELDHHGRRLRNEATKGMYYFDTKEHVLMQVELANPRVALHETTFGEHLYRRFGIGATDQKVVGWLATQFTGERGVEEARMWRVLARVEGMPNAIAYQISDTQFILVRPDPNKPFELCENGQHGILFEQACVEPLDGSELKTLLAVEMDRELNTSDVGWFKVLQHFNIQSHDAGGSGDGGDGAHELHRQLIALLYYISPWLLRWRGMQLPIELVVGEAGSGKSSIYELRQAILLGRSRLANMPHDLRDWHASITAVGALHTVDNVHFTSGAADLRRRMSDEMCRLVTERDPHIESRKLYTTADLLRIPVNCVFAMTAIEMPFSTADLLQRSAIFEVQALGTDHDANWVKHRLEEDFGGRARWVAHHLVVVHKFLHEAVWASQWNNDYRASHRLAHYEQSLRLMGRVFGMVDTQWIPELLNEGVTQAISESDWVIQGLNMFVEYYQGESGGEGKRFGCNEIVAWAKDHEQLQRNAVLTNSWRLSKHLKGHRQSIIKATGITPAGRQNNRAVFTIATDRVGG